MPVFTVALLFPDYLSDDKETVLRTVAAETPKAAVAAVRAEVAQIEGVSGPYDFKLLFCLAGAARPVIVDEDSAEEAGAEEDGGDVLTVTVEVSGGQVQDVTSSGGPVRVVIRDYDNKIGADDHSEETYDFDETGA